MVSKTNWTAAALCLLAGAGSAGAQSRGQVTLEPYSFATYDGRTYPAELGKLLVPENRTRSKSRLIQVAFVRLKSTSGQLAAPFIFLAGGPGVPGTGMARVPVYFALFERLRAVADVILLDQRGLGLSTPELVCDATATASDAFANEQRWLEVYTSKSRECAEKWRQRGADLAGYTLASSADDIEDLRLGLGLPLVSLIGHSYGTALAQAMIARHPRSVERAVLAGVQGPDDLLGLPQDWDLTLSRISAAGTMKPVSNDTVNLRELFRQALARLSNFPARITIKDPRTSLAMTITVGPIGLKWLVRHSMTDARNYSFLPALFQTVAAGDNSLLAIKIEPLFNGFQGRSPMANAVDCSRGWSKGRESLARAGTRGALFDNVNLQWQGDICRDIGVERGDPAGEPRPGGPTPVLLLSGSLDGNTPPFQADYVGWGFPRATHIVIENSGHEMLPDRDVQMIVVDFLKGLDVAGRSIRFTAPKFLTVAEAKRLAPTAAR